MQGQIQLTYPSIDSVLIKQLRAPESIDDPNQINGVLSQWLTDTREQGYLTASIDSIINLNNNTYQVDLYLGDIYLWNELLGGNVPENWLDKSGFRPKLYRNKRFDFQQIEQLKENILNTAASEGYPFASVKVDQYQFENNTVSASLSIELNQAVYWQDLDILSDDPFSKEFLLNFLNIRLGQNFDSKKVGQVSNRLRELPFLSLNSPPKVQFTNQGARLQLDIEKKKANRFDFILGFLPNNQQLGRLLLTGSFNGELQNALNAGERIYVKFEQLRPETQFLRVEFNYPFVLNLPFGLDLMAELYRRDTTFLDVETNLGIKYLIGGNNYVKAFWNNRSSNLLAINEAQLLNNQSLPQQLDISYPAFGLEGQWEKLDYRFNPRKGWSSLVSFQAGTKRIRRNSRIEELELGFLYDSLNLRSAQYRLKADLAYFLPLFQTSTLKLGIRSALTFSDEPLLFNEHYRIGGNRLLRGFDEESIFASQYIIGTLEYRLLIAQNSFLYAFGDYAWVRQEFNNAENEFQPYGFGAGISFETSVGLFSVSVAAGGQQGIPIDLGRPKLHFGYLSRF
ncbi:MAG: BamA/TamA family outer membrane protein [Bacteroidota bacterium]